MTDRFKKISTLENEIFTELKEIDKVDFAKKKPHEQKNCYHSYETCKNLSKKSSKNMNQICEQLTNLVSKIKPFVIPNERNWKKWTASDFTKSVRRLIEFWCFDCFLVFF